MPLMDTSCLYSTVKNIGASALFFGYLGRRGKTLAVGEQYTIKGHVLDAVRNEDRSGDKHIDALLRDVEAGRLDIVSTPAPLFSDAVTGQTKTFAVNNGTLQVIDPCWETSLPGT